MAFRWKVYKIFFIVMARVSSLIVYYDFAILDCRFITLVFGVYSKLAYYDGKASTLERIFPATQ